MLVLCCFGQVTAEPPNSQSNVLPNDTTEAKEMTNDVQRDQSAPSGKTEAAHVPPTTTANPPTDPPFISFPVTKTPGKLLSNMSFSSNTRLDSNVRAFRSFV